MKKLLCMCAILLGFYGTQAQNKTELKQIRMSSIRLRDVIYELSLHPGYVHLKDGNGWDLYVTSNPKKNWIVVDMYDENEERVDKIKVREEAIGGVSILKITTSIDDFYTYMGIVPQQIKTKVIW